MHVLFPIAALVVLACHPAAVQAVEPDRRLVEVFRQLREDRPQTVVVYGTSLTAGGAWTGAMRDWFEERYPGRIAFINSGGPGQTSEWGAAELDARVLAHRPNLVLIEFSYNDAHRRFDMPLARSEENLRAMVERLRAADDRTAIVPQTMTAPWDATETNPAASSRPRLEAYNDGYRRLATEQGLTLLDHDATWRRLAAEDRAQYEAWLPDGSHPTPAGSLAVTWPTIRRLLEAADTAAKDRR